MYRHNIVQLLISVQSSIKHFSVANLIDLCTHLRQKNSPQRHNGCYPPSPPPHTHTHTHIIKYNVIHMTFYMHVETCTAHACEHAAQELYIIPHGMLT